MLIAGKFNSKCGNPQSFPSNLFYNKDKAAFIAASTPLRLPSF